MPIHAAAVPSSSQTAAGIDLDHLSWSSIQCYAMCPKKFFFRYVEHAPEEIMPSALAFGSAFHRAFEYLHQTHLEGQHIPELKLLLAEYQTAWQEGTKAGPEVKFNKGDDADTLEALAERMLSAYREHVMTTREGDSATRILAIEQEDRFHLLADAPPMEMRLDLLELRGQDLIVTDLKTSRNSWSEAKLKENLPQLVLYATGLVGLLKAVGAKRIVPQFVVVSKGKSPKVQVLEPQATRDDVVRLKVRVAETWAAIRAGVFVQREGWQCSQCPYAKRCLGR